MVRVVMFEVLSGFGFLYWLIVKGRKGFRQWLGKSREAQGGLSRQDRHVTKHLF